MDLKKTLSETAQIVNQISELDIILLQQFESQESQALKSYSLLALMDAILFYRAGQTFFHKLFLSIETLMNSILDSQISFPDIFQWAGLIGEVITVLQRLFLNFTNINQKYDRQRCELELQVNGKKLDLQEKSIRIKNEKFSKWQLFETNTFILKHFNTKKHDPEKLYMDINLLEEQESRLLQMILKCESDHKFLSMSIGGYHRQINMCINEIYKIIRKLHLELREDRIYEFIQDQKILEWRKYAPECISLCQEILRYYGTLLGTNERLSDRVKSEYYPEWKEQVEKSQKQLLSEIQSVLLYSRKEFPQECGVVLSMLDKTYKK